MDLKEFFKQYNKVAIAFSGGVDSAYLLYCAKKYGADVRAYYVKSQFQPQFELEDAIRLSNELEVDMKILNLDVLSCYDVAKNDEIRCYYCKQQIFNLIKTEAINDGFDVLLDGTNASDDADDRPGIKALEELQIISPLRLCGITKNEIRQLSKQAGLFTWDKPAYACLATRIKPNERITLDALEKVESAEKYMMSLGFENHRVRVSNNNATIRVPSNQTELFDEHKNCILNELKQYFDEVNYERFTYPY